MQNSENLADAPNGVPSEAEEPQPVKRSSWRTWSWLLVIAIVVITCIAGFIPRGSFSENWVDWDEDNGRTQLGNYGLAYGEFPAVTGLVEGTHSMLLRFNIVPQPFEDTNFHFLAHIGTEADEQPFIIGQWQKNLIIMQGFDFADKLKLPRLGLNIEEHVGKSLQLDLSLHLSENVLYANGEKVSWHEPSIYVLEKEDAHISIGNGPDGKHGWEGGISNLSIERVSINDGTSEVIRNFDFASNQLPEVTDTSANANHLKVPKVGRFPQQSMLDALSIDDLLSQNLRDTVINFVGFAPLGFALCLFLFLVFANPGFFKVSLLALSMGVLFSLAIELSQQFIPGRNSHLHDLILNSAGALLGIIGFWVLYGLVALAKRFSAWRARRREAKLEAQLEGAAGVQAEVPATSQPATPHQSATPE